ncbi:hypothetical protein ILUMI_05065 [Ignelater luminosus]|uniref:Ankyrin repeat and MYND domain-containing protein 1 n=1 Tax=Ignelater luminosus TaxID=2038154 RepID=A0A8K0GGQ7_IGNLU|nr:hypothetical protein ILUMI_05065 [Ignelater luminosus]
MEGKELLKEISKSIPVSVNEYNGKLDEYGLRAKYGDEQWNYEYYQRYKGGFLRDSLHGRGKYSWTSGNNPTIYEGMFYANDLEGYGKFSYNDTAVFEGLFKNNARFGPGVFTYADGSQDVGMWNGKDLIRLSCIVKPEWVPRIARTPPAKVKLLKFKKLVSVCDRSKDRAKQILEGLGANEDVMKQSDKLYSVYIKNPKSNFFNKNLYDTNYFCDKHCYIEVALTSEDEKNLNQVNAEAKSESTTEVETIEKTVFTVDNECVCENQKEIRLTEIKSELDHTEEVLKRIREEVTKAKRMKYLIKKRNMEEWQLKQEERPEESLTTPENKQEFNELEEIDDKNLENVEFNLDEEMEIILDYSTACKMLDAAESAERLLLRKKSDLINKLVYETTTHEEIEDDIKPPTRKVLITDLLAWNNEELSVDMLKHVFLHRNFEKYISFCIGDLLAGNRSEFRKAGTYEENCVNFLKQCSNGNIKPVIELFRHYDLYPDLCDAKGNTGMIYAAARDKTKIIKTLVNFGANVDILNDECFTPLGICIARYLAVQENVTDWENAFLKPTSLGSEEQKEVHEWRPHISLASISSIIHSKLELSSEMFTSSASNLPSYSHVSGTKLEAFSELFGSSLEIIHSNMYDDLQQKLRKLKAISQQDFQEAYVQKTSEETPQTYIFNIDAVKPPPPPKSKPEKKGKKEKKPKAAKKSDKASKKSDKSSGKHRKKSKDVPSPTEESKVELIEKNEPTPEETLRANKLNAICETISILLKYGANPNICEVPMPSLILAVFTKNQNIIEDLLLHNADPNITTMDEKLTALHVLVSLPPCQENVETLKLLLEYSADPNLRSDICHWNSEKLELLANWELKENDTGKTPLHLLAMRYDFSLDTNNYLNEMVSILLQNGGKGKLHYLGHTPLSLAMMRGNTKLVRTCLETKQINPNQKLGEDMGVPLTLYILKRYKDMLPDIKICQEIIQLLVEFKANPFDIVNKRGNLVDFILKEHEVLPSTKTEKGKKGKKDKGKKGEKGGKKGKKGGKPVQDELKPLLFSIAKTTLERHMQGYAVKYLYFFVAEEDFYDDISENMAKFVTPEETLQIAQLLFYRGEIPLNDETNYDVMYDLIEFIINVNAKPEQDGGHPSSMVDIDEMLKNFEFKVVHDERGKLNLREPETEKHADKYNACFNCYRKKNCQLFICPNCNMVYYCSDQCNRLYYKQKQTIHKCGTIFYDEQKAIHDERLSRGAHWKRTSEARKHLEERGWLELFHDIKPDPARRLHLTRNARKRRGVSEEKRDSAQKSVWSDVGIQQVPEPQESILSLRWRKEGSGFLTWKGLSERKLEKLKKHGGEHSERKRRSSKKRGRGRRSTSSSIESTETIESGELKHKKRAVSEREKEKRPSRSPEGKKERISKDDYEKDIHKGHEKGIKSEKSKSPRVSHDEESKGKKHEEKSKGKEHEEKPKGKEGEEKSKGKEHEEKPKGKELEEKSKGKEREEKFKEKETGNKEKDKVHIEKRKGGDHRGRKGTEDDEEKGVKYVGRPGAAKGKEKKLESMEKSQKTPSDRQVAKLGVRSLEKVGSLGAVRGVGSLGGLGGLDNLHLGRGSDQKVIGYVPMPVGGRILELKRRLPSKYQYFLEKISTFWPELDLSMLFLPYACFKDGQLYYKFLSNKPIFMETYSNE